MQEDLFKRPKVPLNSLILLFAALSVVGILVGGLVSLISNFIYLIILFPIGMGFASGLVMDQLVIAGKLRSRVIVIVAAIFAAGVTYGSMHFFDYIQFRNNVAKEIQAQVMAEYGEPAADEDVQAYIDYFLTEDVGAPGFLGFILLEAEEGVSISHAISGNDSGINLGVLTWGYWLLELGIIGWRAGSAAFTSTQELFCEQCDAWVAPGDHIGGIAPEAFPQTLALAQQGNYTTLADMLQNGVPMPSVEFYTRTCKTCGSFPYHLTGVLLTPGQKGQVKTELVFAQILNSSQRFALLGALATQKTPEHVRTEL